jgi:fumarate reductase subunit C
MTTAPAKIGEPDEALSRVMPNEIGKTQGVIGWSSLFFAVLQSVCSFFVALDGLRFVIGVSALASVVSAGKQWDRFHTDWVRVPMIVLSLVGALLNLTVLLHVRYLRSRPSAQWRSRPLTPKKLRAERVQLALSVVTLVLVAVEEISHWHTFHRL